MTKGNPKSSGSNKNILRLTYFISAVFALMIGYLVWFVQVKAKML